jgi:hypothetical protein
MVTYTSNVAPTVSLISPTDKSTFTEGKQVTITANASDFDGTITKVEFYEGTTLISSDNNAPYSATWNPATGNYIITAKATDNGGATSTSQAANVTIAPVMLCTETSKVASQGAFTVGYKCTYETVGSDVTITFELLDSKAGLVAYLWKESPFAESAMTNVSGNIFSTTISGQTVGAKLSYACKFAYAGGMSVTKYMTYVVGANCGSTNDTQAPMNFTATVGTITPTSIELLVNATDNSGTVVYTATYGGTTKNVSVASGVQTSFVITALTPQTAYSFAVTASDLAGNSTSPIALNATTALNTNTECSGAASEASQGSFSVGYKYWFETVGTDVNITFELMDDKAGLVAYLWNYTSGFAETAMTSAGGKKFTTKLSGKSVGSILKLACKFAFSGGMSVTKQFNYTVGNKCDGAGVESVVVQKLSCYPNPVINLLHLTLADEPSRLVLTDMVGRVCLVAQVQAKYDLNMSDYKSGIYFITVENGTEKQTLKVVKK